MITQANRQIRINTALGSDVFIVRAATIRERLSTLFEIDVELLTEKRSIDYDALLGTNVTIALRTDQGERYFNGFISSFGYNGVAQDKDLYSASVVPWLWFTTQRSTCRIHHNVTAKDIIEKVLDEEGFTSFEFRLSRNLPQYEYCVQYRESHFSFISRLMEREGLYYWFEHHNGHHIMVISDAMHLHKPVEGGKLRLTGQQNFIMQREEVLFEWRPRKSVQPGQLVIDDFDFKAPGAEISATSSFNRPHALSKLELYDYPGGYTKPDDGGRYAKTRLEARQARHHLTLARGNTRQAACGRTFRLEGHPVASENQSYLVVETAYALTGDDPQSGGSDGSLSVSCEVSCMPTKEIFRAPLITPKPRIPGLQTAIVNNPSQKEIEADEYGRVHVLFHWDRNGDNSLPVRVSQAWAGNKWGGLSLPRHGHEVIVEFIEGDPDRPIITGRLYNENNQPPYNPKDKGTITTFKSKTDEASGFNELRFDDKAGEEQIFLHAQYNMDTRIQNDSITLIGKDSHTDIMANLYAQTGEALHATVGTDTFLTVGENVHLDAGTAILAQAGSETVIQSGTDIHIKAGTSLTLEASTQINLKVGGSFISMNPGMIAISGSMVLINSGGSAGSGLGTTPEIAQAPIAADESESGEASKVTPPSHQVTAQQLDSHPVSAALIAAAESGSPFCEICNQ